MSAGVEESVAQDFYCGFVRAVEENRRENAAAVPSGLHRWKTEGLAILSVEAPEGSGLRYDSPAGVQPG